ncbi:hypothetical protein [Pontibacter mangrovi]|uniref:Uncharacterized protein n=1 Tax=Pontibacter mangrovi TaxID=2589816 RepID=A0A501W6L0_9BACT|nr:hypothetical protein [Pontibacter mangrovi]TPE44928.1 hypothetical protein FJM65_07900 [Pontibacter mangrovi]
MLRAIQTKYGQAGFRSCLLTFFQPGVEAFYATAELGTIATLGLSFQEGLSAFVEAQEGSTFAETQTTNLQGDLYIQSISLAAGGLSVEKRELLRSLSGHRVHALVQDMSGNWWLYGQERGLRVAVKSASDTGMSLAITGLEREPARRVAASLIPGFLTFLN